MSTSDTTTSATTTSVVGTLADFGEGTMKMAKVGTRRVAVIRTPSGLHALDNACPHEGYGLVTGALKGEVVTCQWHNWDFDVRDGSCLKGEEAVPCHRVTVDGDEVSVTVTEPSNAELRATLIPSLRSGLEQHYTGQVARDTARLVEAEARPAEVMAEAVSYGAARNNWGIGHEIAMAADCLAWSEIRTGQEAVLPLVHGLAGIAETARGRPARDVPAADASIDFAEAIESEDIEGAMASVLGAIEAGDDPSTIRNRFIESVSQHHLGYGHGIIYTQKSFEMLDRMGWDQAPELLPHLAASVGWSTREDLLPYMRKAMRQIETLDLEALATADDRLATSWSDPDLIDTMLTATDAPITVAADAVLAGAGIEGLLDAVTIGSARRLMRHDLDVEFDMAEDFGWLDITHALTMCRAVRWAWRAHPGPHTARLAMFAAWLLFDSGRAERRYGVGDQPTITPVAGDAEVLQRAIRHRDATTAMSWVAGSQRLDAVAALTEAALADQSGSFIVTAHVIKLTQASAEEAEVLSRSWPEFAMAPLVASARFLAAPRLERFVTRNVVASQEFVRTGAPPKR